MVYFNIYSSDREVLDVLERFEITSSANSWEDDDDRNPPYPVFLQGIYKSYLVARKELKDLKSLFDSLGLDVRVGYTSVKEPVGSDGVEKKVKVINMYIR